ncbi:putative membrane protein [Candidatus Ichthyocystis hellenicum]|uniref:Putative membrane protein n=1 Tax=Candidatus Ichthyocystis hellenicum TaxID=1561003 RepID=A0A0S4M067_9BURK|nr:putative membrane protein [Candidatus Ichthyocystis hellenicum]
MFLILIGGFLFSVIVAVDINMLKSTVCNFRYCFFWGLDIFFYWHFSGYCYDVISFCG